MNNWFKQYVTSPVINALGRRKERICFREAPIFIGGCARSGTTLLLAILSAHPRVFAFPRETDAFTQWSPDGKPVRIDRLYRAMLSYLIPRTVRRWCEKRPYNVRYISQLLRYYGGDARFIHLVRDPRAVCTSIHPRKPGVYWVSPERYVRDVLAGLEHSGHPQVYTLKYECLVQDPDEGIRRLCHFLDLPVVEEILNWYDYATVRSSDAWPEEVRETDREAMDKWRRPEHAGRVEEVMCYPGMCELMETMGYE